MKYFPLLLCCLGFWISAPLFSQVNTAWTDYRGPNANGTSPAQQVPLHWSETSGIKWKSEVPGQGWSSPVVLNGQIWLTTALKEGHELLALCYDLESGQLQKQIVVFQKDSVQAQHPLNSFASPTPALEENRLYVHFGAYGTACLDTRNGSIIWKREDIGCEHEVGPGSSPILYNNLLIFNMDGTDVQYVIALNKETGKTVWKRYRGLDFSHLRFDEKKAFYTPIITRLDGRDQLINPGPHGVMGYDPQSGNQIWFVAYKGFSGSSRPLLWQDKLFINTGFGFSSLLGIRLGGTGDLTDSNTLWENRKSMQARSSPVLANNLLFLINTGGQAKCLNPNTGEVVWQESIGSQTSASPVCMGDLIYSFDEDGKSTVFKAAKEFVAVAENNLSEGCMASPAVLDGALILRTKSRLYRIGN